MLSIGIQPSPEVAAALSGGAPVVALESTIITHGMPYPANAEMASAAERIVVENGAVPATIAIIAGTVRVGLSRHELDALACDHSVAKASRRDIAALLATGATAGTTVSATMFIAAAAGIGVFATGGIGGVHRGAAETFDISADLRELGTTPVAVVSAGVKSILDIPRTVEFLETQGVPILGHGTDEFPAFFSRTSGCKLDHRYDNIDGIARAIAVHRRLEIPSGMLIVNPIPEAEALPREEVDGLIEQAVAEAREKGISGKDVTPHVLSRLAELTRGRSLRANRALIENNAAVAARIAVALSRIEAA